MFKCIVFHFSNFSIENRIRSIDSKSLGNLQPRINLHLEVFQVGGMACRQFGLRFNRVKNDCSLWHDTGRGIFWQFLFLATLLFEYKKKSSLNKWISSLEITFLSFFHKRERERKMTLVFHSKNSLIKLWSRCHAEIFTGGEYFPIKWRLLPPSSPVDNPNGH